MSPQPNLPASQTCRCLVRRPQFATPTPSWKADESPTMSTRGASPGASDGGGSRAGGTPGGLGEGQGAGTARSEAMFCFGSRGGGGAVKLIAGLGGLAVTITSATTTVNAVA